MRGEDPFHMAPLEVSDVLCDHFASGEADPADASQVPHMGTPKNPVKVFSLDHERILGCTGFPVDSHE